MLREDGQKNDFKLDTQKAQKQELLHRMGIVFGFALFLTGFSSAGGLLFLCRGIAGRVWLEIGGAEFAWRALIYLVLICCFVSLCRIAYDERPFSRTLVRCLRVIGGLFVLGSFIIPRLSGYQSRGFECFSFGGFGFTDGFILLPGRLTLILSRLIEAGFEMQREKDEIL